MYARNVFNFLAPSFDRQTGAFAIDYADEIVKACLIARGGSVVHPLLTDRAAEEVA